MLITIKNKIFSLLQLILIIIYIIFEELIWEVIAKPIYKTIHSLEILKKIEHKLITLNSSIVLSIFIILLVIVEGLGIYAGILFISKQVTFGIIVYLLKIPITAFTFWLFNVTKNKLMEFSWFNWSYTKLIKAINLLKSSKIYIAIIDRLKKFKNRYFQNNNRFLKKIKHIYLSIKLFIRR